MGWESRKAKDLLRDPRILVHSVVTNPSGAEGEYKLRGRAVAAEDFGIQTEFSREVTARLGWTPEVGRFHHFRVDVEDVTFIHWDEATNDQFITRWPEGVEFVRRGTSATSQGPPEPISGFLS
jgi:hypothetical protein